MLPWHTACQIHTATSSIVLCVALLQPEELDSSSGTTRWQRKSSRLRTQAREHLESTNTSMNSAARQEKNCTLKWPLPPPFTQDLPATTRSHSISLLQKFWSQGQEVESHPCTNIFETIPQKCHWKKLEGWSSSVLDQTLLIQTLVVSFLLEHQLLAFWWLQSFHAVRCMRSRHSGRLGCCF